MILLLAFFITLVAMSVVDEQRRVEALGSLLGAFGILPGGLAPNIDKSQHLAPQTTPVDRIEADMEHIREVLASRVTQSQIRILKGRTRRIISLQETVLFPPDGVEILPEMKPTLLELADILRGGDYPVAIEGHTDDQPPQTEGMGDNWQVSADRALNILKFFIVDGGLNPARLSAFGYADTRPLVANTSPKNRARNRRIDIVLDETYRTKVMKYQDQQDKPRLFDFKGFTFRLFGGKERP